MEHFWPTVEGFFSQPECDFLQAVLDRSDSPAHFVEVGSWKGRSAAFMAVAIHNSGKNVKFDCVDTWEGSDEIAHHSDAAVQTGTLREVFEKNMKPVEGKYTAVQLSSVEAAKLYKDNSLDFVFLDASHDYENVVADILAWLPKIKEDGIIGGHDALHPPIVKACADTIGHVDLNPARDCWYKVVQKIKDNILIIPAGPDSLFQNWNNYDNHNFDLAVINWGTHQLSNLEQATYVEHIPGYKWKIVSEFAKRHDLSQYKHIWILDDDCLTTPENIAATFDFCKEHNLDLAQPGLTPDSSRSHPPTLMIPGAKLHYTNTVEIMAPIFSQRAWPECSEHFGKMPLGVGYGLEGYWSDILQSVSGTTKFGGKVAVIDAYPVKHTRTVTGPNDYARMGIDPGDDGRYFQSLGFGWSFNTLDVLY